MWWLGAPLLLQEKSLPEPSTRSRGTAARDALGATPPHRRRRTLYTALVKGLQMGPAAGVPGGGPRRPRRCACLWQWVSNKAVAGGQAALPAWAKLLQPLLAPPLLASYAGVLVGAVPALRGLLYAEANAEEEDTAAVPLLAPVLTTAFESIASMAVPLLFLQLGAAFLDLFWTAADPAAQTPVGQAYSEERSPSVVHTPEHTPKLLLPYVDVLPPLPAAVGAAGASAGQQGQGSDGDEGVQGGAQASADPARGELNMTSGTATSAALLSNGAAGVAADQQSVAGAPIAGGSSQLETAAADSVGASHPDPLRTAGSQEIAPSSQPEDCKAGLGEALSAPQVKAALGAPDEGGVPVSDEGGVPVSAVLHADGAGQRTIDVKRVPSSPIAVVPEQRLPPLYIASMLLAQLVVMPLLGWGVGILALRWGWFDESDPLVVFMILFENSVPTSIPFLLVCIRQQHGMAAVAQVLLWGHVACLLATPLWATVFIDYANSLQ